MAAQGDGVTVLIAVDGSNQAEEACDFYLETLHKPANSVILMHCLEVPYQSIPLRADMADDLIKRVKDEGKSVSDRFCQKMSNAKVSFRLVSDFGAPGEFIVKLCKQEKAGLVVMGTRGLGKFRRTMLGSVSDYVLHHVHCCVVIYKRPGESRDERARTLSQSSQSSQ